MNIIFMGTPEFAVTTLDAIINAGHNIQAVFTQPDKPKGRGYKLTPPPVKVTASTHNIQVFQPNSLKKGEDAEISLQKIKELSPDLIVVVAYGKMLPKEILESSKFGCINVHASLLPKYRGAGPIQWSVLNGEKETGVTTMQMAEGIDTGDMLLKKQTPIGENETATELQHRLSIIGADLLIETLDKFERNILLPEKQDDALSTNAPMLTKELCAIDFSKSAQQIHNLIRGLSDWPCATAMLGDKKIKIFKSEIIHENSSNLANGLIVKLDDFTVSCGEDFIKIIELQTEGGKRMKATDFLRGKSLEKGTILK